MKKGIGIIGVAAAVLLGFVAGRSCCMRAPVEHFVERVDTLVVRDTITREKPVFVYRWITRTETVLLPVHDTTTVHDSVLVEVPIETKVYQEDSLYRAVVSGFRVSLDTLKVWQTTKEITKYVTVPQRKRWGVGVQAGYGFGKDGLTPFVGVGVSYNLINF